MSFALFTLLTFAPKVVGKSVRNLARIKAVEPNCTRFFFKEVVSFKNILDEAVKILINLNY